MHRFITRNIQAFNFFLYSYLFHVLVVKNSLMGQFFPLKYVKRNKDQCNYRCFSTSEEFEEVLLSLMFVVLVNYWNEMTKKKSELIKAPNATNLIKQN